VVVKVVAAGVNFADTLLIGGTYQELPELPFVPGAELAGEVVEVGSGVTRFSVGDRVMGQVNTGAFAEYAMIDARRAAPVPSEMPFDEAAGFWIPYGTAYCGLTVRARLKDGETLLVSGAAGSVGLAAVQVGAALGARVIALATGIERQDAVRRAGADLVFDPQAPDLLSDIRDAVGAGGVDVALDVVGGALTPVLISSLGFQGRLLVVGFASGAVPPVKLNHVLVKNIDVIGFYWGPYQQRAPAETRSMFNHLGALYAQGALQPRVAARYSLERTGDAVADLLSRRNAGRVIIDPVQTQGGSKE
jgi:NADPH2:quinone reductase